jgi:hypothetical protein
MGDSNILVIGLGAALGALGVVLLLTMEPDRRRILLSFLLGATAGLVAAQVLQVHLFTYVVVVWVFLSASTRATWTPREVVLPIVASAILASTSLYGELVNSPTLGLQLLGLTISAALIVITATASDVRIILFGLLAVTSIASFLALGQVAGVVPNDAWHLDVSALGRPTGIYPEPDWLGLYAGLGLVLAWRLDLRRWLRVALIAVNTSAWVLAFARAAWVAVVVAAGLATVVYLVTRRKEDKPKGPRAPTGRVLGAVLTGLVAAVAVTVIPSLHENLVTRLSRTLTVADNDISAQARVLQNDGLNYLARTAPWNGWGLSSAGRVGVSGRIGLLGESRNNVGSNWLVSLWVDGAWLSLPLIAVFAVAFLFAIKTIQAQLLLTVLLSSIFSNSFYQPITWLLLALCLWTTFNNRTRGAEAKSKKPGAKYIAA